MKINFLLLEIITAGFDLPSGSRTPGRNNYGIDIWRSGGRRAFLVLRLSRFTLLAYHDHLFASAPPAGWTRHAPINDLMNRWNLRHNIN
jgi:hypothetical protein